MTTAALPRWDLSPLYAAPDDPAITRDLEESRRAADAFAAAHRGRVGGYDAATLAAALAGFEDLLDRLYRPSFYAQLAFATATEDPAVQALLARVRELTTDIGNRLQFFDIEIKVTPAAVFDGWLAAPALATYAHHLRRLRRLAPHTLSEPEERLAAVKDITGRAAFAQLYSEVTAAWRIPFEVEGETRERSLAEMRALRSHGDREVRRRASAAVLERHRDHAQVLVYVANTLWQDHRLEVDLRRFDGPMAPTLLDDELSRAGVEALMSAVESRYGLAHEYYRLKARALGIGDFATHDLLAPYAAESRRITWAEAQADVESAFAEVSPEMRAIARGFFAERRIDAEPRPGKRDGAFCSAMVPALPPWVLTNFTGRLEDVSTLAHELGHGVHFVLAGRAQRLLNYWPTTPLAETASVFGEMVLGRRQLERERDPGVRRQLLAHRIEDALATIMRQVAYTRFEQHAHARRAEGVVPKGEYCGLWRAAIARLYGDAVRLSDLDGWGWITIPHFIAYRFYCYSYAFGQLLVFALYRKWEQEGAAFVPRLFELLAAGGSQEPGPLLARVGIDIADPAFWGQGLDVLAELIREFEEVV
ncbi:MAG TPA: M3 family oligoendopeptidase [Polyangia bacterium]|jgi:oligoendopeptidase F